MRAAALAAVGLFATIAALNLILHLGQIRHNELAFAPEIPGAVEGERFASVLAAILDQELHSTTGWRPNDLFLWGPWLMADNNANRQLGIVVALRETLRVFKDHMTKVSSDPYDLNLVEADTLLRNDVHKFWFPSAEGRLAETVERLRAYVAGLHTEPRTSRPMNRRNVEAIRLFQTWSDMLGDAHAMLYREGLGFFATDDAFYYAQGLAHVMEHVLRALAVELRPDLEERKILAALFDEVILALSEAAALKPLVILDGDPASLFANHRRNLDTYVSEARQKMYSIREEIEK